MPEYCAAPWVESVLYQDGSLRTCCRSWSPLGNWKREGLKNAWCGEPFQDFRKKTREGKFPHESCQSCHGSGIARSLTDSLADSLDLYVAQLKAQVSLDDAPLYKIKELFPRVIRLASPVQILNDYLNAVSSAASQNKVRGLATAEGALQKLFAIGMITRSYLEGDLVPPMVAPFRQVHLISGCNARCIHCPGKYTGEIYSTASIDEDSIGEAFSFLEETAAFYMNGSELFLYGKWKEITNHLLAHEIRLDISTNGILLTPEHTKFLIDNKAIRRLNVSMDGARKETVESIRQNVHFDTLIKNIEFLLDYVAERQFDFCLSFSFVLMKRNYKEFPGLVRLISLLKRGRALPTTSVYCQALENYPIPGYVDFVRQEHHALIDRDDLVRMFEDAQRASKETALPVYVFYSTKIEDFARNGFPIPPLPF